MEFLRDADAAEDISVEDLGGVPHLLRDGDASLHELGDPAPRDPLSPTHRRRGVIDRPTRTTGWRSLRRSMAVTKVSGFRAGVRAKRGTPPATSCCIRSTWISAILLHDHRDRDRPASLRRFARHAGSVRPPFPGINTPTRVRREREIEPDPLLVEQWAATWPSAAERSHVVGAAAVATRVQPVPRRRPDRRVSIPGAPAASRLSEVVEADDDMIDR